MFSCIYIRIMRLLKHSFHFFELIGCKRGTISPLFTLWRIFVRRWLHWWSGRIVCIFRMNLYHGWSLSLFSLYCAFFCSYGQAKEYFASLTLRARTAVRFKIGWLNQIELKTKSAIFKLAAKAPRPNFRVGVIALLFEYSKTWGLIHIIGRYLVRVEHLIQ